MRRLLIVSNRLPVSIEKKRGKLHFQPSMGGLATGLGSFYKSYNSTWIGWPGITVAKKDEDKKKVLKKQLFDTERDRRAMVIAVGGSKSTKQFDSVRRTMKAYFDSLQVKYVSGLYVNQIDEHGDVEKHSSALSEAFRLGSLLVEDDSLLRKPADIELT